MLSFNSQYFFSSLIIIIKSSWLISLFINASDTLLSMLFNLLLANIIILLCFSFLLRVVFVFRVFFSIPVDNENVRLRLALAIHAGVTITVANNAIEILPLVADKTIKDLSK